MSKKSKFPFKELDDCTWEENFLLDDCTWEENFLFVALLIIFVSIIFLGVKSVSAQNETCTDEICPLIINETIKTTIEEKTNCSEQLTLLLNTYNDLVEDYKNGSNCGTIRDLLIDNNAKLSDNLKKCNTEKNPYMLGFYFLFIVGIILALYWLYLIFLKSQEEKNE
jgi:hypothetical protein